MLKQLESKSKLGIEINSVARENAKKIGIETVSTTDEVSNDWADVLISSHALEDTSRPLDIINELLPKLKKVVKSFF